MLREVMSFKEKEGKQASRNKRRTAAEGKGGSVEPEARGYNSRSAEGKVKTFRPCGH